MRKLICLLISSISICYCFGQKTEITGAVTDSAGNALANVSVKERATKNGTISDKNGYFRLNTTPGTQLEVSIVGYRPVVVQAAPNLSITLSPGNTSLTEVVVTALGIRRTDKSTGYCLNYCSTRQTGLPAAKTFVS